MDRTAALVAASRLTDPWIIARSWVFDPLVVVGLGLGVWWYARALLRMRRRGAHWPVGRSWAFFGGLAVLALALMSPIDPYSDLLLSVHMFQHLLLTMIAPPLLLLGAPITLALRTAIPPRRASLAKLLRSRTVEVVGNPVLGWTLFAATLWATHLPAFYDATLRHNGLHAFEHLAYVGTALLFWRPLVGRDPGPSLSFPARVFAMFLIMPQMAFLGLAIYSSDRALYAPYILTSPLFGTTAVQDQQLAGVLMWTSSMIIMVPAIAFVVIGWMNQDEREAKRSDARLLRARARAEPESTA
jgi:putative membrane protein